MKKLVVFTGAGIDAESGLKTFRNSDGLWEQYKIEDVASYTGWQRNPQLVLDFYNERHRELQKVEPNDAHKILSSLELNYDVHHITQNVSDLLERAGCTKVLHLHGELTKMRSCDYYNNNLYDWPYDFDIKLDSVGVDGWCLRPHVVWFGEPVTNMNMAYDIVEDADIFVIIGTSLNVFPAAGLIDYLKEEDTPIYMIDPDVNNYSGWRKINHIKDIATKGTNKLRKILIEKY